MQKATPDFLNFSMSFSPHFEYPKNFSLSKNIRWFVYSLFLIANILISLDHGSIPASTQQLRTFVHSDQAIGLFGSFVFVGNIIGSIISFYIINIINRKTILVISLFLLSICLTTFVLFTNILFLFLNRILVGVFQSYVTIYLPVWCNQFGIIDKKSLMITFGQVVVPIGVFLGYLMAAVFIQKDIFGGWKLAFIIQGIGVIALTFVFALIPKVYFDSMLYGRNYEDNFNNDTIFAGDMSLTQNKNNNISVKEMFKVIIKHKVFLFSALGLSALFYVITGVQYWVSDYMDNILLIRSANKRLLYFTIVCFTSPTFGVFFSGFFINKIGGYEQKHSILYTVILSVLACLCAVLVPLISDVFSFIVLLWLVLFFGGGILPVITGIIITSLPKSLAAPGNSVTTLFGNLFGYLPAPYIYGVFTDIFDDKGQRGMMFTMWYSIVGVILIAIAAKYRYKEWNDKTVLREEDENRGLIMNDETEEENGINEKLLS